MYAVIGGDERAVIDAIAAIGMVPANRNGAGQIVAAGPADKLAELQDALPAGSRAKPLVVAAAFHTRAMAPARTRLAAAAAPLTGHDPTTTLLSNADGAPVPGGPEYLALLVTQVTRPVRWDLAQATLAQMGVTGIIELAPGGVLAGIARRALPGIEIVAVKTPDDIAAAAALVAKHG
jgi:[acyl-carrier-protein] S-malonyltransferase